MFCYENGTGIKYRSAEMTLTERIAVGRASPAERKAEKNQFIVLQAN